MIRALSGALRRRVIDSPHWRGLAYRALSSAPLNRSTIYRALYRRRIVRQQKDRRGFPRVVSVESTSACNASCVMCGHRIMKRPVGRMSWGLYKNIVDQARGWPLETFFLSGFGEPLLDPGLAAKAAYAREAGVANTAIVTNASLLTPDRAAELRDAGLGRIHLSLDAASPAAYSRLRPGLDFGRVMENIDGLLRMRPRPAVVLQLVLVDQGPAEVRAVIERFRGRVERLTIRQAQDWAGRVALKTAAYSPHLSFRGHWPPCRYLWDQLNVCWDGTVPACCLDFEAEQPLGNARRQSLEEIWLGPVLGGLRKKHDAGRRGSIPLCRRCRYFPVWW
ncbi:MAG TPA: hypothetical protein DDW31_04055 [candidate division Zixibacteria bacterium]|nr:hypothetical protein [candidate division Zixibacteria bacterium]